MTDKKLTEMTLEELWELFPVALVPHSKRWKGQYEKMHQVLASALKDCGAVRIEHIGSTALEEISAKNIVDILVELDESASMEEAARAIEQCGYIRMSEEAHRMSFNRGYTEAGFADEVFHVHLRCAGDNDELYFRDYLRNHPAVAAEYEALKLRLCRRFAHDRDAYTAAKGTFIAKWTAQAKQMYPGKYDPRVSSCAT